MPKKYKMFTVLRAPHNYGISKEHFHLVYYKSHFSYPLILAVGTEPFFKTLLSVRSRNEVVLYTMRFSSSS
jgi:ribosomal protein S10